MAGIHLRVLDPAAGTHNLYFAETDYAFVAHGIAVPNRSFKRNGHDFHVVVRMFTESHGWRYHIVVEDTQHSKLGSIGIVIIREGKGVICLKPAVVGPSSGIGG